MLLPRKWALSLGLLAAAPSLSVAGPFDFLKPSSSSNPPAAQATERTNQEVAEDIAKALGKARLEHKNVQIEYKAGVATISGYIKDAPQRALVTRLMSQVDGVRTVENKLELIEPGTPSEQPIQQAAAAANAAKPEPVSQAVHQGAPERRVEQVSLEQKRPLNNQQVAQQIADALVMAGLSGYDIEIRYKDGIASLIGSVEDKEQVQRAQRAVEAIPSVNEVLNRLTVKGKPVQIQPTGGPGAAPGYPRPQAGPQGPQQQWAPAPQHQGVSPVAMQQPMPPGPGAGPQPGMAPPPGMGMGPAPGMAPPPYAHVQPAGHQIYNQPQMPAYAWPSYVPYDNYAGVTYPSQYDASAWPYIGPYYPYPQVPLGWRAATLEWDDGNWNLKFSSRTDKWWWFLNPHNWH